MARKNSRWEIQPRFWLMMMAVLLLAFAVFYGMQNGFLEERSEQIARLEIQREQETQKNAELTRKIAFAKTDEFIEREAREKLGLIKPGDVRFVASGSSGVVSDVP